MVNPFNTGFVAVFQTEVLLNSKRAAPYVLMLLFTAHAILWWGWSAAATYGWATNSDYNIVRNLQGFSFILGLPIFNAVMMSDAVIRDFRVGIDPLIFSKPISRASYLLGKFFGNFFVLVCCQLTFALTMMFFQWVPSSRVIVHQARVWPYFKHFFFFVVISHLILAAIYFTVGTLTRNSRVVYGFAVGFYPVYIAWQILVLKGLPGAWRIILDPMLLVTNEIPRDRWTDAAWINQIVVSYSTAMVLNRALMIAVAALCLTILCLRFSIVARDRKGPAISTLDLSPANEIIPHEVTSFTSIDLPADRFAGVTRSSAAVPITNVTRLNDGIRSNIRKLVAATGIELRLLRTEKSLVVIVPLIMILSFLALPFAAGISEVSPSAAFARSTAQGLLVFLVGIVAFFIGESMHREQEVRFAPILWSAPAPNYVFLFSKFIATMLLVVFLLLVIVFTASLTQLLRRQTPIDISAYLVTYSIIIAPGLAFTASACMAIHVMLRDKYLAYAVIIAIGAGLFYLYTQGYNHWLYNPLLWGLWGERDLIGVPWRLVTLRIFSVAITLICLLIGLIGFERKSARCIYFKNLNR